MQPDLEYIIDLHCDTITKAYTLGTNLSSEMLEVNIQGFSRQKVIQVFAIFIPDHLRGESAMTYFLNTYAFFKEQLESNKDKLYWIHSLQEIQQVMDSKKMGAILSVEGGAVLSGKIENIKKIADLGVKIMTLTWNGHNEIAGGVHSNVGFSPFGKRAIAELEKENIIIDVSHLNKKSFWELTQLVTKPIIATHSNAQKICNHVRNLDDQQIAFLIQNKGLIGLNFHKDFISNQSTITLQHIVDQILYFLEMGCGKVLAIGSDYDGANIPECINSHFKLYDIYNILLKNNVGESTIKDILFDNAFRFFKAYFNN